MIQMYQEIGLNQAFLSKMPKNGVKLLNWLIDQMRSRRYLKDSIKNISIATNLEERTVQRWLAKFKGWGIITKEQLYGIYSHNTITLNRTIFKYAKYLKYQLESLWRYLFFVYVRQPKASVTPLIEEDVFNNPSIKNGSISKKCKKVVFNTRGLKNRKKEEMDSVMVESTPKISETLREVTNKLRLTKLGQLKLLVFEDSILSEAWSDYKRLSKINHPFDYLILNCVKKSERRNIPVYWDLFYTSCKRYGLEDNKKYVQDKPEKPVVEIPEYKPIRPHADKTQPHPMFASFFEIAQQNCLE